MPFFVLRVTDAAYAKALPLSVVELDELEVLSHGHGTALSHALATLPADALSHDDAFHAALELLERCSLTQLHALKLTHLSQVQRRVAQRTVDEAQAKVAAEAAGYSLDDRVGLTDAVPPESGDMLAEPTDLDEDGDEVLEPTPHVRVNES